MQIDRPEPQPRDDGSYLTYVNDIAYGKPYAKIYLDEGRQLALRDITLPDALRLAAASAQVAAELTAAHARMTAPHGGDHFYKGTCQLCGKPEDDELHAAPAPSGAQVRIGGELVIPTRDGLCEYCQVEPATVTLANGRYCDACAPGVQMATGAQGSRARPSVGDGFVGPERTLCECGHQRGTHMSGSPRPCEMTACDCGKFTAKTPASVAS